MNWFNSLLIGVYCDVIFWFYLEWINIFEDNIVISVTVKEISIDRMLRLDVLLEIIVEGDSDIILSLFSNL